MNGPHCTKCNTIQYTTIQPPSLSFSFLTFLLFCCHFLPCSDYHSYSFSLFFNHVQWLSFIVFFIVHQISGDPDFLLGSWNYGQIWWDSFFTSLNLFFSLILFLSIDHYSFSITHSPIVFLTLLPFCSSLPVAAPPITHSHSKLWRLRPFYPITMPKKKFAVNWTSIYDSCDG